MKITLRRLTKNDLYKLTHIITKDVAESANLSYPFTRSNAEDFIKNYNTWGIWINNGVLVGAVEVKESLETAYFVTPTWQGKGIATYAVKECQKLFGDQQLWCVINPNNSPSLRVAQKAVIRVKFINL